MIIKMLKRSWVSGESRLLALAVALAVLVLALISIFTARLENTLINESNSMLGADYIVESPQPLEAEWLAATPEKIARSQTLLFASMAYADEAMQLVSVKAVSENYPLRGHFDISQTLFAASDVSVQSVRAVPAPGEVWVDARVLAALNLHIGDQLGIGEMDFRIAQILVREPDAASLFSALGGPRVLMNLADVAATEIVQPGSRVTYQYLFASDELTQVREHRAWIEANKTEHLRVKDLATSEGRINRTLDTARQFLAVAAAMAVLLAGVAIAIAARRFSEQQVSAVALLKSLGMTSARIRRLYLGFLTLLGALAALLGLALAQLLQASLAYLVQHYFSLSLAPVGAAPYVLSFLAGVVCLMVFALPALWFLPTVPPLRVLRSDILLTQTRPWVQLAVVLLALVTLIAGLSRDGLLALTMTGALALIVAMALAIALGALMALRKFALARGGIWRIAFANLHRRRVQSAVMIIVFAVALMLLLSLVVLRSALLEQWRAQIPPDAPNHFLVNIPAQEVGALTDLLQGEALRAEPLYPMVRGRLVAINGAAPSESQKSASNSLRRELNLTWSSVLASDNQIVAGRWWDDAALTRQTDLPGVSIEQEDAARIGLELGDVLSFSLGGLELRAEVLSIRSLNWQSMRPNFFYILEPGFQAQLSPTYITSFHLPPERKAFLNQLVKSHPSVMVVELDRVINQIHTIITQVSQGILLVVVLTLVGGVLVLYAAVLSSLDSRRQEVGLLRAMGARGATIIQSLGLEFALLGAIAGLLAAFGAQLLAISIQLWVLKTEWQWYGLLWLIGPIAGALLVALLGYRACRVLVVTAPAVVLREANA